MFHEILFVLSGHPGNVFVLVEPSTGTDPNTATYAIAEDFPLLHPAEREALNRFGQLGWMYRQLELFIVDTQRSIDLTGGIYQHAFAGGLSKILAHYQSLLLSLEQRWVKKQDHVMMIPGGMVPLSFLTSTLGRWELVIPSLLRLVQKIQQQQQQGQSRIFKEVMAQIDTGIPELHNAMTELAQQLSNVFLHQVTTWMIYGELSSQPCVDFFLAPRQPTDSDDDDDDDGKCLDLEWQRHYTIHWDRIPDQLLSREVAESIFYVGRIVATLRTKNNGTAESHLVMPATMQQQHLTLLRSLYSDVYTDPPITSDLKSASPEGLGSQPLIQPSNRLTMAWASRRHQFEHVVHRIRRSTTDWLFSQVFEKEHDLIHYFSSFRQVFLLGDGELAIRWLEELNMLSDDSDHTDIPPLSLKGMADQDHHRGKRRHTGTPQALGKNDLWQQQQRTWYRLLVKASLGTEAEDQLNGYTFDFNNGAAARGRSPERIESLSFMPLIQHGLTGGQGRLVYQMQWPIDLFLGYDDMLQYSDLWTFLMALKNVQMNLNRVFVHPLYQEKPEMDRQLWRLRSLMLFWVDTLWGHFQENVINRHYDQLMTACHGYPLDFNEMQKAHERYLNDLTSGCLLSYRTYRDALFQLLDTCFDFCELVKQDKWGEFLPREPHSTQPGMEPIFTLENNFTSKSDHFFGLMSSERQKMKLDGHLNELLMRLDYNKWYSAYRYKEVGDLVD